MGRTGRSGSLLPGVHLAGRQNEDTRLPRTFRHPAPSANKAKAARGVGALQRLAKTGASTAVPPLPVVLLLALCQMAVEEDLPEMVMYLLVVFHCYFRPLELLQVTGADIWVSRNGRTASVTLMNTKTSKTKGPETVALDDPAVIWWLMRFRPQGTRKLLDITPHSLRGWFMAKLLLLDPDHAFQLYSLRRGGATAEFLGHRSVERAMLKGRWRDPRSCSI